MHQPGLRIDPMLAGHVVSFTRDDFHRVKHKTMTVGRPVVGRYGRGATQTRGNNHIPDGRAAPVTPECLSETVACPSQRSRALRMLGS